jgi:RNA 2',3'-cyclic 3'-phosphodiesterase
MSVFLAVDLDAPTRSLAESLIETHRAKINAKWLRIDKLHCTVVFLGHPKADQLAHFAPTIDALASRHSHFTLRLAGAGTFVTPRAPSVLWLGIEGDVDLLSALHRDALSAFRTQERPFIPHVTLARSQATGAFDSLVTELAGFASADFAVTGLSLYESTSEVYRVIHSAPLTRLNRSPHVHG